MSALKARHESGRNKNRGEHQRDSHQRSAYFVHCFECRILGRSSLLDLCFDSFDHDDCVVHDQAHRQHQAQQRKCVDREADRREEHESAHKRDRDREHRDQRRAPVLQKDEDHQDHQADCLQQCLHDLAGALGHGDGRVQSQTDFHVGRKVARELGHLGLRQSRSGERIGAWVLVKANDGRRRSVGIRLLSVGFRAELNPRDILQPHQTTVRVGANDDVPELLRIHQASLRAHGVSDLLAHWRRRTSNLTRRIDDVLCRDRILEICNRQLKFGENIRRDPNAHRIVGRSK